MALLFDATGERDDRGSPAALDNVYTFTFASWFYLTRDPTTIGPGGVQAVLAYKGVKGGGDAADWFIGMGKQPNFQCFFGRVTESIGILVVATNFAAYGVGKWLFLFLQIDVNGVDTDQKLFLGDVSTAPAEPSAYGTQRVGSGATEDNSAIDLWLGNSAADTARFLGGRIAWAGLWDRVLTADEMLRLWRPGPRIIDSNAALIFSHLGLGSAGTQPDWSGNGHTGTVSGATVARHAPIRVYRGQPVIMPVEAVGIITASVSENLSLSEEFTRTAILRASLQEGLGLADTQGRVATLRPDVAEDITLEEILSAVKTVFGDISENIDSDDVFAAVVKLIASISEALILGEDWAVQLVARADLLEDVNMDDVMSVIATLRSEVQEGVSLTDAWTAAISGAITGDISEDIILLDSMTAVALLVAAITANTQLSSEFTSSLIALAQMSENIEINDIFDAAKRVEAALDEEISVTDLWQTTVTAPVNLSISNVLSDLWTALLVGETSIVEDIVLGDTWDAVASLRVDLSENIVLSEAFLEISQLTDVGLVFAAIRTSAALAASINAQPAVGGSILVNKE